MEKTIIQIIRIIKFQCQIYTYLYTNINLNIYLPFSIEVLIISKYYNFFFFFVNILKEIIHFLIYANIYYTLHLIQYPKIINIQPHKICMIWHPYKLENQCTGF